MCEFLQIIICLIEVIFPFGAGAKILERRYQKLPVRIIWYLGVAIFTGCLIYQRHFYMFSRVFLIFTLICTSVLFWRYFKTSLLTSILILSIYYESIYVMDLVWSIFFDFFKKEELYLDYLIHNITYDRILIFIFSRVIILGFSYLLIHKSAGVFLYIENKMMIAALPIVEYVSLVQCDIIFYGKREMAVRNLYSFLFVYVVLIFILIIQYIRNKSDYVRKLNDEKTKLIEADYERVLAWNRQREIFIHDANKHYIILEELLAEREYERALQYVKALKQDVQNIARKIATGNLVLDAVLNEKMVLIEECGIMFSVEIDSMEETFVGDQDWCIIFSNLLDNAIEATQKEKEKFIGIHLKKKDSGIIIHIENSFTGRINTDGKQILTTKKNDKTHGWGLRSVRQTVDRYSGVMNYEHKDNVFHVYIMLYG